MSSTKRRWLAIAAVAVAAGAMMSPAVASAQPVDGTETEVPPAPEGTAPQPEVLHNVIYRARADGTSRDAVVAYKMDDENVNSAQPTMLPGQTFEVNAVLADPKLAGMELSIEWPYGSNLHCEILVDDQIVAQADQFIAPRFCCVRRTTRCMACCNAGRRSDIPATSCRLTRTADGPGGRRLPNAGAPLMAAATPVG